MLLQPIGELAYKVQDATLMEIRSRYMAGQRSLMGIDFLTSFSIFLKDAKTNVSDSATATGMMDTIAMITQKVVDYL